MLKSFTNFLRYSRQIFSIQVASPRITPIEPGLLVIKGALSPHEQQQLSQEILKLGDDKTTGFWKSSPDNTKVLNSTPYRGRMFGALSSYPSILSTLAQKNLTLACEADKTLRPVTLTHSILLYYKTMYDAPKNGFIPWHQDNGENDGDEDYPVVAFTLGDSCEFLINHSKPKTSVERPIYNPGNLAHNLLFESGDLLFFGGPSRKIWHSIFKIHPGTAPSYLPFEGARLNATLRYTPELLGQESRFATQDAATLPQSNQFYDQLKMK